MNEQKLKRLTQRLLATTCLTVGAVGAASASSIDESAVAGGSFGASFSQATLLSTGTTTITGSLCDDCGNIQDWFEVPGFIPGSTVGITGTAKFGPGVGDGVAAVDITAEDSLGDLLGDGSASTGPVTTASFTALVGADGDLIFEVALDQQNDIFSTDYEVDLNVENVPTAPEPGTLGAAALALAAGAVLDRKLKKA